MRYTGKGYLSLLKKRRKYKHSGKMAAWRRLGTKASRYRKRMIAANSGHTVQKKMPKSVSMDSSSRSVYERISKTADGKKVAKRFKQFWKIPAPPSVKLIKGGPKGMIPLVGMGHTNEVHISSGQKGQKNKKEKVLRGRWEVATEKTGKHVVLLSKRPMSGGLKPVGYAPVTFYIPPSDVEKAGTHKKGVIWKHKHGEADGKSIKRSLLVWPKVFADRNGQVDASSNFVYGSTPKGKITTWMYHN